MSYIDLTKGSAPSTPSSNHVELYIDTADKKLKTIDDTGLVLTCAGYPSTTVMITGDVTNSTNTLADITGLSFAMTSGESWAFMAELAVTGITNGTNYGVAATPTGTLVFNILGNTSAVGTFSYDRVTAVNTASAVAFATSNTTAEFVRISGTMIASSTATFKLQFKSVTNGNTSTVKAGSYLRAWRVS